MIQFLEYCKFTFYSMLQIVPSQDVLAKLKDLCTQHEFLSTLPNEEWNYRKLLACGMCLLQLSGGFRVGEILDKSCIVYPSSKSEKDLMKVLGMSKKNDMEAKQHVTFKSLQESVLKYHVTPNYEELHENVKACCDNFECFQEVERYLLHEVTVDEIMCFRNNILFALLDEGGVTYESLVSTCNNLLKTCTGGLYFKKFTRNGEPSDVSVPVTTHDLRGLYATESYKAHAPAAMKELVWIQKVLGHNTTSFDSSIRYSRKLLL